MNFTAPLWYSFSNFGRRKHTVIDADFVDHAIEILAVQTIRVVGLITETKRVAAAILDVVITWGCIASNLYSVHIQENSLSIVGAHYVIPRVHGKAGIRGAKITASPDVCTYCRRSAVMKIVVQFYRVSRGRICWAEYVEVTPSRTTAYIHPTPETYGGRRFEGARAWHSYIVITAVETDALATFAVRPARSGRGWVRDVHERPMIPIPRKVGGDGRGAFVQAPVPHEAEVVGGFLERRTGFVEVVDFGRRKRAVVDADFVDVA